MTNYIVEEPQETDHTELTANKILENAGFSPEHFYLVEVKGKERISFEGKGHEHIRIHEGQKFICIHIGPTPVSELALAGPARFLHELREMGFQVEGRQDGRICFAYEVDAGKYMGRTFRIGVEPPPDFPLQPPSGIHVSPTIHPRNTTSKLHPEGGIHDSPFGVDFQYWSRPCNGWSTTRRRAADYVAFVRQLWATQ